MYARFDDWQKDPSSDLYQAVEASFGKVGVNAPDKEIEYGRRLGAVQVQAATEFMSDLDIYAARFVDFASKGEKAVQSVDLAASAMFSAQWKYDAFISHASEDKIPFVRDLAEALTARGLVIWYDTRTLKVGDGLRESIDEGLLSSRYGIVVLSHAFFRKDWPRLELEGLFSKQTSSGVKVILPVWHGVNAEDVGRFSPMLAGRLAAKSADGVVRVTEELMEVMRPRET
jgi:hypothetical protein